MADCVCVGWLGMNHVCITNHGSSRKLCWEESCLYVYGNESYNGGGEEERRELEERQSVSKDQEGSVRKRKRECMFE